MLVLVALWWVATRPGVLRSDIPGSCESDMVVLLSSGLSYVCLPALPRKPDPPEDSNAACGGHTGTCEPAD
jgi:hypothetical protein